MGFTDKILVPLFMVVLKTKRIAKSAVNGKLNYNVKKATPYVLGLAIIAWTVFVFTL